MAFAIKNLTTKQFDGLNFSLQENGLYGIIGRNGAGKSTLFTAINREMELIDGEVHISGHGRVAYLANLNIFDKNLTAMDYIHQLKLGELRRAKKLMPVFSADRFFEKKIKSYSLGMQEILAFILTVSIHSDLIIIDELMNGLDNTMRESAFRVLKEISQDKVILLTSHILEEVENYCDEVYFLSKKGFSVVTDFEEAKKLVMENEVFV